MALSRVHLQRRIETNPSKASTLPPLNDKKQFVRSFSGKRYTNIVGLRGNTPISI